MQVQVATPTPPPPVCRPPLALLPAPHPPPLSICSWLVEDVLLPRCWSRLSRPRPARPAPEPRVRLNARTVPRHLTRSLSHWRVRLNRRDIGRYWAGRRLRSHASGGESSSSSELEPRSSPKPLRVKRAMRLKRKAARQPVKIETQIAEDDFEEPGQDGDAALTLDVKSVLESECLEVWHNAEPEILTLEDEAQEKLEHIVIRGKSVCLPTSELPLTSRLSIIPSKAQGTVQPVSPRLDRPQNDQKLVEPEVNQGKLKADSDVSVVPLKTRVEPSLSITKVDPQGIAKETVAAPDHVESETHVEIPLPIEAIPDMPKEPISAPDPAPCDTKVKGPQPIKAMKHQDIPKESSSASDIAKGKTEVESLVSTPVESIEQRALSQDSMPSLEKAAPVPKLTPPDSDSTPSPDALAVNDHSVEDHDYVCDSLARKSGDKPKSFQTDRNIIGKSSADPPLDTEIVIPEVARMETVGQEAADTSLDAPETSVETKHGEEKPPSESVNTLSSLPISGRKEIVTRLDRQTDHVYTNGSTSSSSSSSSSPSPSPSPLSVTASNGTNQSRVLIHAALQCPFCFKQFGFRKMYESHLVNEELMDTVLSQKHLVRTLATGYTCQKCATNQVYLSRLNMVKHVCLDHKLLREMCEVGLRLRAQKQLNSSDLTKCELCQLQVVGNTFVKHLIEHHFKHKIEHMIGGDRVPYLCSLCSRQFDLKADLVVHLGRDHYLAMQLYQHQRREMAKKPDQVIHPPAPPSEVAFTPNVEESKQKDQEVYVCVMCRNSINDQGTVFHTDLELRNHLVQKHLFHQVSNELRKSGERSLKCPETKCQHLATSLSELYEHFLRLHCPLGVSREMVPGKLAELRKTKCDKCFFHGEDQRALVFHCGTNHPEYLDAILTRLQLGAILQPQRLMPSLPVVPKANSSASDKKNAAIRNALYYHSPGRGFQNSLPKQRVGVDPAMEMVEPVRLVSVLKRPANMLSSRPSISPHAKVKVARLEKIPSTAPVSVKREKIALTTSSISVKGDQKATSGSIKADQKATPSVSVTTSQGSLTSALRMFRPKKVQLEDSPNCHLCDESFVGFPEQHRKSVYGKHLYRIHFQLEIENSPEVFGPVCKICQFNAPLKSMKVHYYLDHGRIWNLLRNRMHPPKEWPTKKPDPQALVPFLMGNTMPTPPQGVHPAIPSPGDLNSKLAVRFMSDQRTLFIRSIGNVNNFESAISTVRILPESGSKNIPDTPNSVPFNPEVNLTTQEKEHIRQIRIKMKTFSHVRHQGQVILQRHACFEIGNISPFCHACATKVDAHTICQFEGFRRIVYRNGLFESAGFKCPYKTPNAKDTALWLPSQCSNPIGMDHETAKFILEYCAPEFLKMADEEREVVEIYRRDTQNKVKMIWKPLQDKVREMCDVCSTSLFNVHWTCEECCSIICIDCYKVRKNGGMEYKLNVSAKPHKAQRTIANNRDQHMWPFCHAKKLHLPQNLRLTQMICGDILNEVRDLVFKTRKDLLLNRHKTTSTLVHVTTPKAKEAMKSVEDIQNNDELKQKRPESCGSDKSTTSPSSGKTKFCHPKDINHYPRCPLCGHSFSESQKMKTYIHLSSHFSVEILKELSLNDSAPFACASCEFSFQDKAHLVLHLGMAHNAFDERLRSEVLKATNPKTVVLKVDTQPSCTVCNMSYLAHQMGRVEIRTHLMTHFRKSIATNLVPTPDHHGMMACPDCPVVFGEKSRLITHLGIFHKRLDEEWSKAVHEERDLKTFRPQDKQAQSLPKKTYSSDWFIDLRKDEKTPQARLSCGTSKPCNAPPPAPTPVPVKKFRLTDYLVKKAQENDKENSTRSSPKMLRKRSCTVCRDMVDTRSFSHHWLMHHQDQILRDFAPSNEQQVFTCQICPKKLNPEKVVRHYGLTHEKFAQYSSASNLIVRNSAPKSKTICPICFDPILTSLTNHLSVHLWLTVHMIRRESETKMSCAMCSVPLKSGFLDHLLTNHFNEVLNDFWLKDEPNCSYKYAEDANLTKNLMAKLIQIFTNRFCVLCEVDVPTEVALKTHYVGHLYKDKDLEDLDCKFCDHFPSFDTVSEFQSHFAKEHYEERIQIILEAADRFQFIESLRSKLQIEIPLKSIPGSPNKEPPSKATPMESPAQNRSVKNRTTPKTFDASEITEQKYPRRSSSRLSSRSNSVEEEDKMHCEFCNEGHLDEDYYSHMALGHFRAVFEQVLPPNPESPNACPRCIFKGETRDELILHYAEYHQMLAYFLRVSEENQSDLEKETKNEKCDPKLSIVENAYQCIPITPEDSLYLCSICGYNSSDRNKMSLHVFGHLRTYLDNALPHHQPHICPICQHESRSRERLIMHYSRNHLSDIGDLKSESFSAMKNRRKIYRRTIQHDQLTGFHLKMIQSPADKPKKEIESNMKNQGVFQNLMIEMRQSLSVQNEEKEEIAPLEFELEPHSQISGERLPRIGVKSVSSAKYPGVKHEWLCEGRLLVLDDPKDPENKDIFQEQWKRGQPVIIANSSNHLDPNLWSPAAFLRDFGHIRHSLINCLNGNVVPNAPLKSFWRGFEYVQKRLRMKDGRPMLLKLKDWPPTDDIAEYMPDRFDDLINSFSMPDYTLRNGKLNLAAYLPNNYLKPELGPKMYIAYGSALYSDKGSTNLHIDMSDAVNCLVYVGMPKDGNDRDNMMEVFKEIDKAGCDILMKKRSRLADRFPGALWHIFHPTDTPKIRAFLKQVAIEKRKRLNPHDDPIHDQSTYLDETLRVRLYKEYGVQGYAIVQCMGDTVFIPAGACHQVRNLHNCIKVAEDFVSPENISHCLHLTQEFRHLTEWHTNHEDKLQIKSILYHAIKTALAVLQSPTCLPQNDVPI